MFKSRFEVNFSTSLISGMATLVANPLLEEDEPAEVG